MPPALIINPDELDFDHPIADIEAIRRVLPQRHEMEQLTAILSLDPREQIVVAYKEVRPDEFWVRGHLPGFPLMPGVLMCEAAAQLASYYMMTQGLVAGDFVAFGGMDNVKFRDMVRPGDRLVLVSRMIDHRVGRRATFSVQGIVGKTIVFHGDIIGVTFTRPREKSPSMVGSKSP